MNEIVKYHNSMNMEVSLGRFSPVETNIFFSLCSKVKSEQSGKLTMSFDELRELSGYKETSVKSFVRDLERTYLKYLTLTYRSEEEEGEIERYVLFSQFKISSKNREVSIEVNEKMKFIFYALADNFTRFELQEFTRLKSSYSKALYRYLKQWRTVGEYDVSLKEFRDNLDIPKSYKISEIDKRVLSPIKEELSHCFENLEIKKQYKKSSSGRGRPALSGFKFKFKPEQAPKAAEQKIQKGAGLYCPACGEELSYREVNGNYCWCHEGGWHDDAECNLIFNSVEEINSYHKNINDSGPVEPTPEQEENKGKLKEMFRNLFG